RVHDYMTAAALDRLRPPTPAGDVPLVSDRSGWWNLYRHRVGRTEPVMLCDAELGVAPIGTRVQHLRLPDWWYARRDHLTRIPPTAHRRAAGTPAPRRATLHFDQAYLAADGHRLALIGATPTQPPMAAFPASPVGDFRVLAGGSIPNTPVAHLLPRAVQLPRP